MRGLIWTRTYYFFADNWIRFPLEVIDFENSSLDMDAYISEYMYNKTDKLSLNRNYFNLFGYRVA